MQLSLRGREGCIELHPSMLNKYRLSSETITLHFGALQIPLQVRLDHQLSADAVNIPAKLTEHITIPPLSYESYFKDGQLHVGPVIGVLVLPLYIHDPRKQLPRFTRYKQMKGLIYIFKESRILPHFKAIRGYYYHPQMKRFIKGTFPYPAAIFNRTPIKRTTFKALQAKIGNTIFNYPYGNTDKWLLWQTMSQHPPIIKHLPFTKKYNDNNLLRMLHKFREVYLKPTTLAGGSGIIHIMKRDDVYVLTTESGQRLKIASRTRLCRIVQRMMNEQKQYIIQQAIRFHDHGHKIDFRVYIQRNKTKHWQLSGMECKVAQRSSIISNSKNRKRIMPGEVALRKLYHLSDRQIKRKLQHIKKLCIQMIELMSKQGEHYGDVAVDLIIDRHSHVWILELQLNYAAEIKAGRTADERAILPAILPTPFEYAKTLAKF